MTVRNNKCNMSAIMSVKHCFIIETVFSANVRTRLFVIDVGSSERSSHVRLCFKTDWLLLGHKTD